MWTELDDAVARDDRTARNDAATEDDIHGHVRLTDGNWGERGRRRGSGKIDVPRRRHERYEVGANGRQTGRWVIDERSGAGIGEGGGAADGKHIRRCIDYGWQEIWESHQAMEFSDIAWQVLSSIGKIGRRNGASILLLKVEKAKRDLRMIYTNVSIPRGRTDERYRKNTETRYRIDKYPPVRVIGKAGFSEAAR